MVDALLIFLCNVNVVNHFAGAVIVQYSDVLTLSYVNDKPNVI